MVKILIIRGNSGCGKSSCAQRLRQQLPGQTLLVSQDVVRREMLAANDHVKTPAIPLMKNLVSWGSTHAQTVILEGILKRQVYQDFLIELRREFQSDLISAYFDVSFETTERRNREKLYPFSHDQLVSWWQPADLLGDETLIFTDQDSLNTCVTKLRQLLVA